MSQCVDCWDSTPCQDDNRVWSMIFCEPSLSQDSWQSSCFKTHASLPTHPGVLLLWSGNSQGQFCCLWPLPFLGSQGSVKPKLGVTGHHLSHVLEGQVSLLRGWVSGSLREKKQKSPIHHDIGLLPVRSSQGGLSELQDSLAKHTFPPVTSLSSFRSMPSWPSHIPALMDATKKEGCSVCLEGPLPTLSLSFSKIPLEVKSGTAPLLIEVQRDPPWRTQSEQASGKWTSLSNI